MLTDKDPTVVSNPEEVILTEPTDSLCVWRKTERYCSCPSSSEHAKHMCCDSHPQQELGSFTEAVSAHCFSSGVLQFSPGA